jgi:hypothetical protein
MSAEHSGVALALRPYQRAHLISPYERIALVARFIYPQSRPQMRDPDNATASLKELIDAVVRAAADCCLQWEGAAMHAAHKRSEGE